MPNTKSAFRNQRVRLRNFSPPYGDKVVFDPSLPSEGVPPRGCVSSRKNGRVVGFWDMREYAAIVLFETTPGVIAYEERPQRLKFRDGPTWFFYVPHFMVELEGGPAIVELSANGAPRTARQQLVAEMAKAHYAAQGMRFVELPHSAMRANPRAANAHVLMRYLSVQVSPTDVMRASDAISRGPASVAQVEAESGVSHGRLLAMVRSATLQLEGDGPVGRSSILVRAGGRKRP